MIGSTVARYRILSKLGGGGMGIVYEAEDLELGRRVALKFLPEDTTENPEALERFKREVRAASALNHPHICTVYDVGRHEGKPFLIMERMSGRTLRQIIDQSKLTIERVIELGEQIADGLDAAHRAGIVHRDLKPTNLFVTDRNEIKILDFGMAKVLASGAAEASPAPYGSSPDPEHHTSPGMVVGTVAYMSPEQARGEAVDARSDLFALGIVLYRMASGRMPFLSVSTGEFFRALLADQPVPLPQLDAAIPEAFDAIVRKCLEKDPALRYQTAADVRADLKRLIRDSHSKSGMVAAAPPLKAKSKKHAQLWIWSGIAAALAALVSIALVALWPAGTERSGAGPSAPSDAAAPEKRIAVLPFENLGSPDDAYFAEGMSDEIQSKLAGLPGLAVIARGSTLEYRGTTKRPETIAKELGVRYLLTATVRWQRTGGASRIRVTPALVEVGSGRGAQAAVTRWQSAYDAELADVFEVQGRIATQVAQALEVALGSEEEKRLGAPPTSNLAAYDAYLRGNQINLRGNDTQTQEESSTQFERAVALDPGFALAWVQLAVARSIIYANGTRTPEQKESARAAAARALELEPKSPDAHWAMAVFLRLAASESTSALAILQRGLELAPDDVNLLRNLGLARREIGRVDQALEPMRRAEQLDPRNFLNKVALSGTYLRLHRPREAREVADRGLALVPGNYDLILYKLQAYLQEGDLAGAHTLLRTLPEEVDATAMVAYFASSGNRLWALDDSLRDVLLHLEPGAFGGDRMVWAGALAGDLWLRGRLEEAKKYAEIARDGYAAAVEASPEVAILHAELGSALAILGDAENAVREGERAVELAPLDKDGDNGAEALHSLVLIHLQLGQKEEAIDDLERVLKIPYWVTPAWLRIDPTYDSLRGNPRFEKLAAGSL
jgi:non-specific serine/threonine protein kinase